MSSHEIDLCTVLGSIRLCFDRFWPKMKYTMMPNDLVKITLHFMHLTCEIFEFVTIDLLVDSKKNTFRYLHLLLSQHLMCF